MDSGRRQAFQRKKSFGVLAMAISGDATITLIADGPDEAEALDGLEEILRTTE